MFWVYMYRLVSAAVLFDGASEARTFGCAGSARESVLLWDLSACLVTCTVEVHPWQLYLDGPAILIPDECASCVAAWSYRQLYQSRALYS